MREKRGRDKHKPVVLNDYSIYTDNQETVTRYSSFVIDCIHIQCLGKLNQRCGLWYLSQTGTLSVEGLQHILERGKERPAGEPGLPGVDLTTKEKTLL